MEARQPILKHLTEFQDYLADKQNTPEHVQKTHNHIKAAIEHVGAKRIGDFTADVVMGFIGHLRDKGKSPRTCNSYLVSCKGFSRWLFTTKRSPTGAPVASNRCA